VTRQREQRIAAASLILAAVTFAAAGYACREPLRDVAWIGLLRYGGAPLRARAAVELGARRSLRAVPHLVRALREDSAQPVRDAAADALGALGPGIGDQAVRALVEALDGRNWPLDL